jgi:hypothetical protein
MLQGLRIAATVIAFVLALSTFNILVAPAVGVDVGAGGLDQSDAQSVTGNLSQPEATSIGQQDPGFFGIATGIARTVTQLWTFTTAVHLILESYGVPLVIGTSIQIMIDLTLAMGFLQIWRAFKF